MSRELERRIDIVLDAWLDVERRAEPHADIDLDTWIDSARCAMLAARDRLEQLRASRILEALELELHADPDEAPA